MRTCNVRPDDEASEKEKLVFLFPSEEERKTFCEAKSLIVPGVPNSEKRELALGFLIYGTIIIMLGNILLTIAVICTTISYLPQVIKTLKTKSSEDISVTSWIIWIVSTLCYISYAIFVSQDPMLVFSTSVELFFCILILILAIKYRNS